MENEKKKKTIKSNITPTPDATAAPAAGVTLPSGMKADPATVRAQGQWSLQLAVIYAVALRVRNYTDTEVQELKNAAEGFDRARDSAKAARRASKDTTRSFRAVFQQSIVYRDELVAAFRVVTQGKPNPFKNPELMLSKTKRAKQLALWFASMVEEVKANAAALTATFGQDAVALLASKAAAFDKAVNDRAVTLNALPAMTEAQKAAKLRLVTAIAKQRFVAELAFAGNKKVLREFVPFWSRKHRATKPSEVQPGSGDPASPGAPANPASPEPASSASAPAEAPAEKAAGPADAKPTS